MTRCGVIGTASECNALPTSPSQSLPPGSDLRDSIGRVKSNSLLQCISECPQPQLRIPNKSDFCGKHLPDLSRIKIQVNHLLARTWQGPVAGGILARFESNQEHHIGSFDRISCTSRTDIPKKPN